MLGMVEAQESPLPQVFPAQQVWKLAPQGAQVPNCEQPRLALEHAGRPDAAGQHWPV
jgi:hypothetical protein